MGLHEPAQITSARDIAILAFVIRSRYPQYDPIFETRAVEFGTSTLKSYNILLEKFRGTTGMKTGFVCASGLNIVATAPAQRARINGGCFWRGDGSGARRIGCFAA